jgi:H+/Cl- antiporter ClcA
MEMDVPARSDDLLAPDAPSQVVHPYLHVVVVAVIGAVSVLAWLVVFEVVNRLLWENDVVTSNPWLFPVICLPLSLLVGLLVKYRDAPTNLGESMLDSLGGDVSRIAWRTLPVNVVMAWVSLFSGAVLGPEGGIGGIASKIAAFYGERVAVPAEHRSRLVFASLASAYNGLIANPLFTGVLSTELVKDPASKARDLPANLIGGAIGFLIFLAVGSTGLEDYLHLPPAQSFGLGDVAAILVMSLVGMLLALVAGVLFRVAGAFFGRFEGREVARALVAGLIFSAVGVVAPIVLFSGETQIVEVASDPGRYGPWLLIAMAVVKLALLAVAFKSGFLGGPTFPAIFASICVALAVMLLFPGVTESVVIAGVMAGFLMVLFRAPFLVILLTSVLLEAGPELIALVVLAVAMVMIALPPVLAAIGRRQASRGGPGAPAEA